MAWLNNIFGTKNNSSAEDVVKFYQTMGFFDGSAPPEVVVEYSESHGRPPDPDKPWDDVFLLSLSKNGVWAEDPEADVCSENKVYSDVLIDWGSISFGAFSPTEITEDWGGENGPVTLHFKLEGRSVSIQPAYLDDWIDLDILKQINEGIAQSGREFAYAVDGNHSVVVCVTPEQKSLMRKQRKFPFAW